MRKFVLAAALAILPMLGGCAALQKVETVFQVAQGQIVTPQAVWVAVNAFDAAESVATKYLQLPRCGTGPVICRDQAISASVIVWIRTGRADRNQLKAALRANPSGSLTLIDVYQDLSNTTAQLVSALANK